MNGFIIPDNIQKAMSNYSPKDFGKVKIEVAAETIKTLDDIQGESKKVSEDSFTKKEPDNIDRQSDMKRMMNNK
jgi:hypothetical protein